MSLLLPILLSSFVSAQTVNVKDIDASQEQETTISVRKGGSKSDAKFEITEGTDDLEGDPAPLQKEARANWKKACDAWKKELKEMNKDNQILTANCGTPQCATTAMETVCKSTAKHKLKVRLN